MKWREQVFAPFSFAVNLPACFPLKAAYATVALELITQEAVRQTG